MHNYKSIQRLFVTLAITGLAACATSGGGAPGGEEPSGDGISIQVTNDMTPPTGIVVWAVPDGGNRRRLGTIPPNGRRSFSYTPMVQSMQIHLAAVPEGPSTGTMGQQNERRSIQFSALGVKTVTWSVSRENVRIGG